MQYLGSEEDEGKGVWGTGIIPHSQDSCIRIPPFFHIVPLSLSSGQ